MSRCRCWGATSYGLFLPLALFFTQKGENLPSASRVARLLLDAACQHGSVEEYARKRMTQMAERQRGNKITESVSFYFSTSTTFLFFCFLSFIFFQLPTPFRSKEKFLFSLNPQNISKIVFSYSLTISKEIETIRQIFEKNVEVIFFNNNQ